MAVMTIDNNFSWARVLPDNEWVEFLAGERKIPGHIAPPVPHPSVQRQYVGTTGVAAFTHAAIFARKMREAISATGSAWGDDSRVLDLGVGWGRVYRLLLRDVSPANFIGADIDPDMVNLCKQAMPFGKFEQVPLSPPYAFDAASFNTVLLYSVFSHLNGPTILTMLEEIARTLKPSGFLFFTTLRPTHLDIWVVQATRTGTHDAECLASVGFNLADWQRKLAEGDILFVPTGTHELRVAAYYGWTILTEAFLHKNSVDRLFEIVQFEPTPSDMEQAFVALRKK